MSISTGPALATLDEAVALGPARAGAKAVRLAAARRAGIAVLDGVVIDAACSLPALSHARQVASGQGTAAARLCSMSCPLPPGLIEGVTRAIAVPRMAVRSSSPLEGDAHWSGAFTSYIGVGPDELAAAIRGCWASVFGRDAIERAEQVGEDPGAVGMAVLVQPAIEPAPGGVADVEADVVRVNVADGDLAGLLGGAVAGAPATVPFFGPPSGPAVDLYGRGAIEKVAGLARACSRSLGDNHLEWAIVDGTCYLLQGKRSQRRPGATRSRRENAGMHGKAAVRAARAVARFGGASGDELVLPWRLAPGRGPGLHRSWSRQRAASSAPAYRDAISKATGRQIMTGLHEISACLTAQAWDAPADEASEVARSALAALRETLSPEPLQRLSTLAPVDSALGRELIGTVERLAGERRVAGELFDQADAWKLPPVLLELMMGRPDARGQGLELSPRPPAGPERADVPRAGAWEPFLYEAALANGAVHHGIPASDNSGAGRVLALDRPSSLRGARERWVLYVRTPLPGYAPLLWGAAGLVSATGSSSAHLFDVARSLGVPAVAGVDLGPCFGPPAPEVIAAVVGQDGEVVVI